ncbi:MAG TPA: glycosyl hydrolase family 28 protein [Opitutaceae bacterium]|jgi:hypothetical protein|nr:glycosyl hydrolase family 28 protein [Opitutaceae bacterium]
MPLLPRQTAIGLLFALVASTALSAAPCNIRDFGAKGGQFPGDQKAIQAAIDACAQGGGGEVLVPAGDYRAGKLVLKSNVTLKLEAGATIWSTDRIEDFDAHPRPREHGFLLVADGQENISVTGEGTLEGAGSGELGRRDVDEDRSPMPAHRFGMIRFAHCRNVHLRDFTIRFSEAHTVIFDQCEDVSVAGVSILNNFVRTNTDGIDPISCRNVMISNCHIVCGDDCICPKTEEGRPLENLVVDNCILESVAGAVKLGTDSSGTFRDIKVSNCVIRNSGVGIGMFIKDGGLVERASFSHLSIETTRPGVRINAQLRKTIIPIYIDLTKRRPSSPLSRIRDVSFSDIQIESDNGILIQGLPQRPIENLTLRNISFRVVAATDFSARVEREGGNSTYRDENYTRFVRQPTYIALAHVDGLVVEDVRVLIDPPVFQRFDRSALALFESSNAVIRDVQRLPVGVSDGQAVLSLNNCREILVTGCLVLPGTPVFLRLAGKRTAAIAVTGSGPTLPVTQDPQVPGDALKRL